jgi:hypothetical protein
LHQRLKGPEWCFEGCKIPYNRGFPLIAWLKTRRWLSRISTCRSLRALVTLKGVEPRVA